MMFGLWGDRPIQDFIQYFLRPATADGPLQDKRELMEIFRLGYGLPPELATARDIVLPVLIRTLRRHPVVGTFSRKELLAAKCRFQKGAGQLLSKEELDQAEQWFDELDRKYCATPVEKANTMIDQWIQVAESPRDAANQASPEERGEAERSGLSASIPDAEAHDVAAESTDTACGEQPSAAADTIADPQERKAATVSPNPLAPTALPSETLTPACAPDAEVGTAAPKVPPTASPVATDSGEPHPETAAPATTANPPTAPAPRSEAGSSPADPPGSPTAFAALTAGISARSEELVLVPTSPAPESSPAPTTPAPVVVSDAEGMEAAWKEVEDRCQAAMAAWNDQTSAQRTVEEFEALMRRGRLPGLLYDQYRDDDPDRKTVVVDDNDNACETYFLGDVHSDLLALEAAIVYLERRQRMHQANTQIVFMGDLFDDGPLGCETLLRMFRLILDNPGRVCLLTGNHDESLGYNGETGLFTAAVEPCEFSEWLNAAPQRDHPLAQKIGRLTIDLFRLTPRALFFQDGLLAAHGGVPLRDLWESWQTADSLNDPKCLQDFVWTRPHPRAKKRIPNRATKGAGLGYEDFEEFCERAGKLLGFEVQQMVRGHDHIEGLERYESFEAYARRGRPMLTINTLCYRLEREMSGPHERVPCLARRIPGQLPEVCCLRIPPELVGKIYPRVNAAI
ncbi:MAG: hypothetical protein GXY83_11150 [Rhodopirellula sp.]|nr:hypothetical protein [Rhodopirellula sp.]